MNGYFASLDPKMTVAELCRDLEKKEGFRITGQQFQRLLHNEELTAQEILDQC